MEPSSAGRSDIDVSDESRSSSASSAEVSSQDPNDIDRNEHGDCANEQKQSEKGLAKPETSSSPTLERPPLQVMEQPNDSSYHRIPSRVFETSNKPNTPNPEWSIASNDSLFSIHNMSLTREEFNTLLKSGELGVYGEILKSGELGEIRNLCKSGELPPPLKDALITLKGMHKSGEQKRSPEHSLDDEKKDDRVSENVNRKGPEPSLAELPCPDSITQDSEDCAPSFASHVVSKSEGCNLLCSSKNGIDQSKEEDSSKVCQDQEEKPKQEVKKPEEPASSSSSSSWFSCFSCC